MLALLDEQMTTAAGQETSYSAVVKHTPEIHRYEQSSWRFVLDGMVRLRTRE